MTTPNAASLGLTNDQLCVLATDLSARLTIQLSALGVDVRVVAETLRVGEAEAEIRLNVTKRYGLNKRARDYNVWAKGQGLSLSGEFFEVLRADGGTSLVTAVAVDDDRRCVEVEDEDEIRYELPISELKKYGSAGQVQKRSEDPRQVKRELRERREMSARVEAVSVAASLPEDGLESPSPHPAINLSW